MALAGCAPQCEDTAFNLLYARTEVVHEEHLRTGSQVFDTAEGNLHSIHHSGAVQGFVIRAVIGIRPGHLPKGQIRGFVFVDGVDHIAAGCRQTAGNRGFNIQSRISGIGIAAVFHVLGCNITKRAIAFD